MSPRNVDSCIPDYKASRLENGDHNICYCRVLIRASNASLSQIRWDKNCIYESWGQFCLVFWTHWHLKPRAYFLEFFPRMWSDLCDYFFTSYLELTLIDMSELLDAQSTPPLNNNIARNIQE